MIPVLVMLGAFFVLFFGLNRGFFSLACSDGGFIPGVITDRHA